MGFSKELWIESFASIVSRFGVLSLEKHLDIRLLVPVSRAWRKASGVRTLHPKPHT